MFMPRKVTERVIERLKALRNVSEEQIHQAYTKEMLTELDLARQTCKALMAKLDAKVKATNPERAWIMFSKEDIEEVNKLFAAYVKAVS